MSIADKGTVGLIPVTRVSCTTAARFMERMKEVQEEAKAALAKAQENMKKYADRHRLEAVEYKVGDLVLLSF